MKVTLLKDIAEYKAGVVEVDEARANYWKAIGVLKGSEKEEEKKAAPTKAATKAPVKEATKAAPKKAATKAKDITTSTIKKGKK